MKFLKSLLITSMSLVFLGLIFFGYVLMDTFSSYGSLVDSRSSRSISYSEPSTFVPEVAVQRSESPNLTRPESNAVRTAKQYLSISGFSRDGLIEQLSSDAGDGYAIADATTAVDNLNVDWNEQAVRTAKNYLGIMGFSCSGLIEQLSSDAGEGYTVSQASYGAQQAGACS